jgi:hypothetical protein
MAKSLVMIGDYVVQKAVCVIVLGTSPGMATIQNTIWTFQSPVSYDGAKRSDATFGNQEKGSKTTTTDIYSATKPKEIKRPMKKYQKIYPARMT